MSEVTQLEVGELSFAPDSLASEPRLFSILHIVGAQERVVDCLSETTDQ